MADDNRYRSAVIELAGLAIIAAMAERFVPSIVRLVLGLPFVVFLPGFAFLNAIAGARLRSSVFLTLAVGLSLAITVIWGFVLDRIVQLSPLTWSLALTGTTLIFVWAQPKIQMPMTALSWISELRYRPRQRDMIVVALGLVAMSIVSARIGAKAYRPDLVTEFWVLPAGSGVQNTFTVGIRNREGRPMVYDMRLMLDGETVGTREGVSLDDLAVWTADFPVAMGTDDSRRLEAWLVRTDEPQSIYRRVWLSARPTFFPSGTPAVEPQSPPPPEASSDKPEGESADDAPPADTN